MEKTWSAQRCAPRVRPESSGQNTFPRHWMGKSSTRQVSTSASIRDMSRQVRDMRSQMEEDERLKVLMASLRGQNLSDADFADSTVDMRLVATTDAYGSEGLPLDYDPELIEQYWDRRPVAVVSRVIQLLSIAGGFISSLLFDALSGKLDDNQVQRATELRNILTSLGPAYIKLGQALSIRPDLLSPAAMNEMQKLCDKVPSFDSKIAMQQLEYDLGRPWQDIYSELTPEPIAAASLGQVYRGRLKNGDAVAVKVQRPGVLETVTVDLFIIRRLGIYLRRFPSITQRADIVALLDEWAARFFEELDYVREGNNATQFAELIRDDLPQVVVPKTYKEYTSRRVLTSEWIDGEKLSQSKADDVGKLVNVGVICYLKQLLDTGFFHADPHPGNLIRTPDGRLAILDFGLMTQIDDNIKYGMIEAISHLIHRDYDAIVEDFVTLDFIPPGTDLQPILPVLAKVFDQALEGGGAKSINFQDLAADLAQITFDYPFRIPPYFALIIRAIGVLEGIALVGDPNFAIVDEAFPYISKRLITDDSPRLRESLRYMVYGRNGVFDAERLIDLLYAFEAFSEASQSARGQMDLIPNPDVRVAISQENRTQLQFPSINTPELAASPLALGLSLMTGPMMALSPAAGFYDEVENGTKVREALKFFLSPQGAFFRDFLLDEAVKSVDALSRSQFRALLAALGMQEVSIPILLPGIAPRLMKVAPPLDENDEIAVKNITKIVGFFAGDSKSGLLIDLIGPSGREILPYLPSVASQVLPRFSQKLMGRIAARMLREAFV